MTPPHILLSPVDSAALPSVVRAAWEGDRGAASVCGVDPAFICVNVSREGELSTDVPLDAPAEAFRYEVAIDVKYAAARALSHLADDLESLGYAVARDGGVRVTGWAAVPADPDNEPEWTKACAHPLREFRGLVRLIDIEEDCPWDERVEAWRASLLSARLARRPAGGENAKLANKRRQWRATYGRGR